MKLLILQLMPAAKQKETIVQPQETPTPESSPTTKRRFKKFIISTAIQSDSNNSDTKSHKT
jgi:hypothetical protein